MLRPRRAQENRLRLHDGKFTPSDFLHAQRCANDATDFDDVFKRHLANRVNDRDSG